MISFTTALEAGKTSTEEALAIFDSLDPIEKGMKQPFFFVLRREKA